MKKTLRVAGGAFVIAVSGFLAFVASRPDSTIVSRSVVIAASPEEVFTYIANLDRRGEWSPWQAGATSPSAPCSEARTGEGACWEWTGAGTAGHGKITVTAVEVNEKLIEHLEFFEPFTASGQSSFGVEPTASSPDSSTLTWTYHQKNDFPAKFAGLYVDVGARLGTDFERGLAALKPLVEVYHQVHLRELAEAQQLADEQARIQEDVAWFVAEADACVLWRTRPGLGEDATEVLRFPGRCPRGHSVAWNTWKDRFVFWDEAEAWVGDLNIRAAYAVPLPTAPIDAMRWKDTNLVATAQVSAERVDGQWVYEGVREATVVDLNAVVCLSWDYTGNPGAPGAKSGVDPTLWTPSAPRILTYTGADAGSCLPGGDSGTGGMFAEVAVEVFPRAGYQVLCSPDHAWAVAEGSGRVLWENAACPVRWEAER